MLSTLRRALSLHSQRSAIDEQELIGQKFVNHFEMQS